MPPNGSLTQLPLPALANPVTVTLQQASTFAPGRDLNIYPAAVLYDGAAPLEVSGLFQMNIRLPTRAIVSPGIVYNATVEVTSPDGSKTSTTAQIAWD